MKTYSKIIFTVVFVIVANDSFAQPPSPTDPACWPVCIPVDNGLIFLMVAIALYGTKKLYDYQKRAKAKI